MTNDLKQLLEFHNIECSDRQIEQFITYFDLLIEWNEKMNLTAITEPREVLIKHFFDSLTPSFYYKFTNQKIIDIGTGAGFPSIPLKICYPDLKIVLLDSLNKRLTFLKNVVASLQLQDIDFVHGRAEDIAKSVEYRESFDIAFSRAVARLNVICELSLPFVKTGGAMMALKGAKAVEEAEEAEKAINLLGGFLNEKHIFQLPDNMGERTIFIIDKIKGTPKKYPRKPGVPARDPIV